MSATALRPVWADVAPVLAGDGGNAAAAQPLVRAGLAAGVSAFAAVALTATALVAMAARQATRNPDHNELFTMTNTSSDNVAPEMSCAVIPYPWTRSREESQGEP